MRASTFLIVFLSGLIVVLVVLLAIGCGSNGGESSPSTSPRPAKEQQASDSGEADSRESGSGEADSGESGSGKSSDPGGAPLSKAAYIKQGDAICGSVPVEYNTRLASLEKTSSKAKKSKPSPAEIATKATVPPLETATTKLAALVPPQGDEKTAEAIVAALESAQQGVEADPKAQLQGPKSPFGEFQKLTREYGFKVCPTL